MLTTFVAMLLLAGVACYLMTPEERVWWAREILALARKAIRAATVGVPGEPFNDFLQERTRWTVVTPLLIALNTLIVLFMMLGGTLGDREALIAWGGNVALRTTNGEWWRLIASTFVHSGALHVLATIAGLVPLGFILERAVGHIAFATIYLASGVLAGMVTLWTASATSVSVGASGAIFGMYGLMLAVMMWSVVSRPPVAMPAITMRRIAAAAAVFLLYNLLTDDVGAAGEIAGLMTGFASGLVVARGVARGAPPLPRPMLVGAATLAMVLACAIPVRGVVDVVPEIAQVIALEERTAGAYDAAVARFKQRTIPIDALVRLIDQTIVPDLQRARAHLKALHRVPREHAPLLVAAEEYFELREQSWRRLAAGLSPYDRRALREAEETERAALEALRKMRALS